METLEKALDRYLETYGMKFFFTVCFLLVKNIAIRTC